jgi:NAD/NADP transhydrogenase alpha subunit
VGTDDQVNVVNWYQGDGYQLDVIETEFSQLQKDRVDQLVNAMAQFDVPTGVGAYIPQDTMDQLEPVLSAVWQ